ncbi:MAG: hypothetical protein U5L03_04300 [Burkholderiaceae bacterium]|nr:hypothetical protein [Burkholderiaceae bacterium]
MSLLFQRQRELGNPHAVADLEAHILGNGDRKSGLFWEQKPPLAGADLLKMLGKCTFEKDEYRAPKASFTAERHVWLTRLNNLRIVIDGTTRPLNERRAPPRTTAALPAGEATSSTTNCARAREAGRCPQLQLRWSELSECRQFAEDKAKDPEDATLVKLPAWRGSSPSAQGQGTRDRMGGHGRRRDRR